MSEKIDPLDGLKEDLYKQTFVGCVYDIEGGPVRTVGELAILLETIARDIRVSGEDREIHSVDARGGNLSYILKKGIPVDDS